MADDGAAGVSGDLECPACGYEHDMGEYPDYLTDMRNNRFEFKCDGCGVLLDVQVDWEPVFWPEIKPPPATPECK